MGNIALRSKIKTKFSNKFSRSKNKPETPSPGVKDEKECVSVLEMMTDDDFMYFLKVNIELKINK